MIGSADLYKSVQKLMYNNENFVAKLIASLDSELDPS
jgi:hypothetical protein